ncbi:MAG: PAS domain-containing protein [Chitinophagaceae bacterium]
MENQLRILLLEDNKIDAELIKRVLLKENKSCEFRIVVDEKTFTDALENFSPRIVLSDNSMPTFSAGEALRIVRNTKPGVAFIMVTGTVSEDFAVNIIKQGADDYILKDRMNRLPAAIETALNKRKAEKELEDYKYALENGYLLTITDDKGIITDVNEIFCKTSGYTREELIGNPFNMVSAKAHPASYVQNIWDTIKTGKIWTGEYCCKAKNDKLYWVDTTIVPFLDEKGNPYQFVSMCSDISERKWIEAELQKSNERFQYATEASSDIIWELNFETREYMVHEGKGKVFEFNKILDWQLGIDGEHVVLEDRARIRKSFHLAQKDPELHIWKEEYRVYNIEGKILYISNHAIFVRNAQGKTIKAIGAISDISDKRKLELQLIEQNKQEQIKITATAVEAQEKERHAIGLELHDNVNQILLGTKLLLSVVKNEKGKNIKLINDCLMNLQNAINENRKIAHLLVVPDFDTISLTDQLYNLSDSMLTNLGIKVSIDTMGVDEDSLEDKYKLPVYRIAQEQCSNIVKYAKASNVTIQLYTIENVLKMIISDDGEGAALTEKITGIGLRNIRGRLSILNGSSSITTSPGKGFTLDISIPMHAEPVTKDYKPSIVPEQV